MCDRAGHPIRGLLVLKALNGLCCEQRIETRPLITAALKGELHIIRKSIKSLQNTRVDIQLLVFKLLSSELRRLDGRRQ